MTGTIVERLAGFAAGCRHTDLPAEVAAETRRIVLDSVGCALAATDEPKGRIGIGIARMIGGMNGGARGEATILGTGETASVFGAAFANGELINALDFDSILPPGHVSPYVIPAALALAEHHGASGGDLVAAIAVAHEISNRLGKAMDYLRDIRDGKLDTPKVYGYSSTIFGATAAAMRVQGLPAATVAHGLGIAGCIVPVNSHMAWVHHAPSTTIKYTVAGVMAQTALTAAAMGELGHRGDLMVLDDAEYGFPRMIGTKRWQPEQIAEALGERWGFVAESSFKPYPHCRVLHAPFDAMIEVLEKHDIRPGEIEGIKVFVEGFVERPIWLNERIEHVQDAQFSIAHGMALAAHRVRPGKAWQDPALVFGPSVMALMKKVVHEVHPDYVRSLSADAASRPSRVEIRARGMTFTGERLYPRGSLSPDPATRMTDAELVAKFRQNAEGALTAAACDDAVDMLLHLDKVAVLGTAMQLFRTGARVRSAA